jgi:hypothetical protein
MFALSYGLWDRKSFILAPQIGSYDVNHFNCYFAAQLGKLKKSPNDDERDFHLL